MALRRMLETIEVVGQVRVVGNVGIWEVEMRVRSRSRLEESRHSFQYGCLGRVRLVWPLGFH
jgi:hypothetical protein